MTDTTAAAPAEPRPDTVADAVATPDREQPYEALGLKADEYAQIREILGRYCASAILVAMREAVQGEAIEYSYQVKLLDPSFHADLLDALRAVEDLKDVNLLMHRATVEI